VEVTVNRVDSANVIIGGNLTKEAIDKSVDALAKKAAKEIKIDGFRAGKAPISVIKKMHGERLTQDAEGELLNQLIDSGAKEASIATGDLIGQPTFKKYEKQEEGIEVEIELSIRPSFDLDGYKEIAPSFERPEVSEDQINEKLSSIANEQKSYRAIETPRAVGEGDMTLIDFEGFIDGEAFAGGKAEKFNLEIGSNQFIPGFEPQIIGMSYGEQKDIVVTFPEDYASTELAGKEATFKVTLHEIQEAQESAIDDALAQKVLNDQEASLDNLKEKVKAQLEQEALSKIYHEELKPKMVAGLVEKFTMDLPNNIVEQEIDAKVNAKAKEMSQEEIESYKDNEEKLTELRESLKGDAVDSVKATFIVDALAKEEGISVADQEVSQMLYYEAMMSGQNGQEVIKYYEENNLLPAVKMGMIEDKLFAKLLGIEG
jgi:trigger factor